jgi:hypothetical protein
MECSPRQSQGCQIFLDEICQNGGKYTKFPLKYQMVIKYTKWPKYISISHYIYQHFLFQGPTKFTQIGIFGLDIFHLAALVRAGKNPHFFHFKKVVLLFAQKLFDFDWKVFRKLFPRLFKSIMAT